MTTRVTFLGVAGYEIAGPSWRVLIDPFLTGAPVPVADPDTLATPNAILVSHAAYDHLGDAARIAKRTSAPVVCGGEVRAMLMEEGVPSAQIQATTWGIMVEVGGVVVRPVECHHWSQGRLANGQFITGVPMGFIVEPEPGIRIYHYGDTAIFSDLRLINELYQPTIGLLGCANPEELAPLFPTAGRMLTGEMSPEEAALAADYLGLQIAIASHYYNPQQADVLDFLKEVPKHDSTGSRQAIAPVVGETLTFDIAAGDDRITMRRSGDA
ncbi:MAG: MBL fold metallo-hydrolase [Chloroflexia bacterium]|nr:MBL fold metallo-hydrolase [Chloroflexia bacterium]